MARKAHGAQNKTSVKRPSLKAAAAPTRVQWMLKSADEALDIMLTSAKSMRESELVPIAQLLDRVLAASIASPLTLPQVDTSERDGYALRSADASEPGAVLKVVGEATAGSPFAGSLKAGTCIRIATGSIVPKGADAVVMFEDVADASEGQIKLPFAAKPWDWIARKGSDMHKGMKLFNKGDVLAAPQIAALGAIGLESVSVLRRPRALVFTTGNEVRQPGEPLEPGQVYDGNTAALSALMRGCGVNVTERRTVKDTLAGMCKVLRDSAEKYDLVVFTGGTSVGDKDYARRALDAEGRTLVHGVAVKPGKPLLFGKVGDCLVVGLPGFPTSAMMLALAFLQPLCLKLAGFPGVSEPSIDVTLAGRMSLVPDKTSVLPVNIGEDGLCRPTFHGSASISSIAFANGYVVLPPGEGVVNEGDDCEVYPL